MARLRFGAPLFADASTPEAWIRALKRKGYGAAYAPLEPGAPDSLVEEYRQAARENDIVIAEVGAWCLHPLSADREIARAGIEETARRLAFADRLGALCCVNVSTSRGAVWDGPDARNLTEETFGMVVESIREILRLAAPEKACYALEMMPWMYPTCLEDEERLLQAVNHPRFRVHYEPCTFTSATITPSTSCISKGFLRFTAEIPAMTSPSCTNCPYPLRKKAVGFIPSARDFILSNACCFCSNKYSVFCLALSTKRFKLSFLTVTNSLY